MAMKKIVDGEELEMSPREEELFLAEQEAESKRVRVPQSVSRAQGLIALEAAGYLSQIEAMLPAIPKMQQIAFNEAQTFERNSPTLAQLSAALGLTDAQVDDLFIAAAKVEL